MKIYDVTLPISEDLPVYPGDPGIRIELKQSLARGDAANVTQLNFGAHTGTHVDAPFHFIQTGITVDQLPIELMLGRTHVLEVTAAVIDETALAEFDFSDKTRVLFKTRNSYLWNGAKEFKEDYVYLTPGAAELLVREGVKVVGIDYLSVEKFGVDKYDTHLALLGAGVVIIEGLDLSEVEPGDYEMACLPLKIAHGDGAPARVVLKK